MGLVERFGAFSAQRPVMCRPSSALLAIALLAVQAGCPGPGPDDDDVAGVDDDSGADDDAVDDDTGPVDADGDGHDETTDCDDGNAAVHPGAEEVCDEVDDNDCDGAIDEGEDDPDGDGYSECDGDCNVYNDTVYPGAPQVCDDGTLDNDCDGIIDGVEIDDVDGDGYTPCQGDCDDEDPAIHPDVPDWHLDGIDDDCDGDVDEDVVDCAALPTSPTVDQFITGARGYHGLAIDDAGFIVGSGDVSLWKCDYQGNASLWVPQQGNGQEMVYLPNGHLAWVVDTVASLRTYDLKGTSTDLTGAQGAYGLVYGPDDYLYMVQSGTVKRVDPYNGDTTTLVDLPNGGRSLDFSPDYSKLYVSTSAVGVIYEVELDANLDPIGEPTVLASNLGDFLDGLRTDICGNLYVPCYGSSRLYRIAPDGTVETFVNWPNLQEYGHGAIFGNGVGGWSATSLFMPVPYAGHTVKEVGVGAPSRTWGGTVLNGP